MRRILTAALIVIAALMWAVNAGAQPVIPSEGLNAEVNGEWEKALQLYREVLEREPDRIDLWLRISDIEAHLGRLENAADALERAADLSPREADIHFRLSRVYAMTKQPEHALAAIRRSVDLEPDNTTYLKAQAQLAAWTGNSHLSADTYNRLLEILPEDDSLLLNYARSSAWSSHTDNAASAYGEYLADHPEEEEIYIEHVKVESWRGNYAGALSILGRYREFFGDTTEYQAEKARVLAWANRPTAAMEIISPLLEQDPDNYDLNYTRTIALHNNDQLSEAVESLDKVIELKPASDETEDLRRVIMTPLRPDVTVGGSFYADSDDLDRYNAYVIAGFSPRPETRITVGGETDYLTADRGSGFEEIDGDENARHNSGWVGVDRVFSSKVSADGHIGAAEAEDKSRFIYGAGLNYRPKDNLRLRIETDYGFYVVSPRSVDLGVRRSENHFWVNWEPDIKHWVVLGLGYSDFSDDNESWEVIIAPRRAVLRREKINVDIGVRGTWYGFDEQLDNGYYDPDLYQSYMVTSLIYWKISDDDGVSLAVDLGAVKDDELDDFRFGSGASIEGTFGLYRDVMLKVGASIFDNQRTEGGSFEAYAAHIALTFRF